MLDLPLRILALGLLLLWAAPAGAFVVQVLAALLPVRKRPEPSTVARPGGVVLVPAHNEGSLVEGHVAALLPQLGPHDRLVLVADNCSDDTAAAARRGATGADGTVHPRFTLLERNDPDRRGKGYALDFALDRLAAADADGRLPAAVFVLDADCRVSPGGVNRLLGACTATGRPVQARTLCGVDPQTDADAAGLMAVSELGMLFKNFVRPRGAARLGLPCQLMGTGMTLPGAFLDWKRAEAASRGGGVFGGDLAEDMQMGVEATLAGLPPLFLADVHVDSPLPTSLRGFDGQRTRWEQGHLQTLTRGVPRLLKSGVLRDDLRALGLAADLAVPPFSLLVVGWFAVAAVLAFVTWWTGFVAALAVHAAGGAAVAAAVLIGWAVFGRERVPLSALASAPKFVLRKLPIYSRFLSNRIETEWVRTERAAESVTR
ncbi:glycosyltransferase family 2 protein [Alienimonas californiensis]|uniref:N-glycosyltransferase n=1 Tax=Alienimonas californiensis TaxID=2527989 RepID=A0A517PEE5_9PLAN|nr:glycosyltransferase [Alienimonas californiensis]QDT17754.1 N-glycosyltransferase [Alienimonas californiensis]